MRFVEEMTEEVQLTATFSRTALTAKIMAYTATQGSHDLQAGEDYMLLKEEAAAAFKPNLIKPLGEVSLWVSCGDVKVVPTPPLATRTFNSGGTIPPVALVKMAETRIRKALMGLETWCAEVEAWGLKLMGGRLLPLVLTISEEVMPWLSKYVRRGTCKLLPSHLPTPTLSLRTSSDCFFSCQPSEKPVWHPGRPGRRWRTCTRSLLECFVAKMRSRKHKINEGTWGSPNFGLTLLNQAI